LKVNKPDFIGRFDVTDHNKFEEAMEMWMNGWNHRLTIEQLRLLLLVVRTRWREKEKEFRQLDKSMTSLERFEKDIRWWMEIKKGDSRLEMFGSAQRKSPPRWKCFKHIELHCPN
jgi:hypothetical protein